MYDAKPSCHEILYTNTRSAHRSYTPTTRVTTVAASSDAWEKGAADHALVDLLVEDAQPAGRRVAEPLDDWSARAISSSPMELDVEVVHIYAWASGRPVATVRPHPVCSQEDLPLGALDIDLQVGNGAAGVPEARHHLMQGQHDALAATRQRRGAPRCARQSYRVEAVAPHVDHLL
eukprot:3259123-Prymnesium_polylepis.3